MEGMLQRVVSIIVAVVIFFILPVYVAYEKRDDISYALALKMTTDFVENVKSKGYISSDMYSDYIKKLAVTENSYDIYLEHTAKKYNPVIYSYTDDLKTVRAKFDYNLYKDEYKSGQITIGSGNYAGTYNNLIIGYDLSEKIYTQDQILAMISTNQNALAEANNLEYYRNLDYRSLPSTSNLYKLNSESNNIYTMNEGDEFNVIIKNKNITMASVIFNLITFGASSQNTTKVYVNYGGSIKAETYRDRVVNDDTSNNNERTTANTSDLINSYITKDLVVLLNGEYNSGTIHSNNTEIWQDLSGSRNDAVLNGFAFNDESGWIFNGLQFTGNEYISIPNVDSDEITVEIVARIDDINNNAEIPLISNLNNGGVGINFIKATEASGNIAFDVSYRNPSAAVVTQRKVNGTTIEKGKTYTFSGSFGKIALDESRDDDDEGNVAYTTALLVGVNGSVVGEDFRNAYIKPATGTQIVIGGNAIVGASPETSFTGTIYSVRVYSRALTETEIKENFAIDEKKYGIK